jgi:hypothetical protein
VAGIRRQELEAAIRADARDGAARRQAALAAIGDLLLDQCVKLQRTLTKVPGPDMKIKDLVAAVDTYEKLRRLIEGEATERVEEVADDRPWTEEEKEAARRLLSPAVEEKH